MTETMTYTPKDEDFVLVSPKERDETKTEAVSGTKNETLKRFMAQKSAVAGLIILAVLILLSIIGPHLTGHKYNEQNLDRANMAPRVPVLSSLGILNGSETEPKTNGAVKINHYEELGITDSYYLFGTDNLGRDLFSRCFMGLRISLLIAFISTVINLIIGMNYGVISGYFGGITDIMMQRIIDVIGSIPTLVIVTLMMIIMKPGMLSIILALMLSGWISLSLIAREEVLKVKELEYIQAARTIGAGNGRIIIREIVPNIIDKLMNPIMLSIPSAVFLEAFLSIVGIGMPAGSCSLGILLSDGFSNALLHPYKLFPPAFIMVLLMISCHLIAEGIKKATE